MVVSFETFDDLRAAVGSHLGWTGWEDITEERMRRFEAATGSADGSLLALSMSNLFLPRLVTVPAASAGVNYGTGTVRFPSVVAVGDRIRGGAELNAVVDIAGGVQTTIMITIEIEGRDEPACVLESLSRWLA